LQPNKRLDDLIQKHPLFGKPCKPAPCTHSHLSELCGVTVSAVINRRRKAGVWAFQGIPETEKPLSIAEKRTYALCALVAAWKRPVGMDALLNEIKNA
jgi:hypothetical protein